MKMTALLKTQTATTSTSSRVRDILAFNPYMIDDVDTSVLTAADIAYIIIKEPSLACKLNTDLLNPQQVTHCIYLSPSLARSLPLDELTESQRIRLTRVHNELCELLAINE